MTDPAACYPCPACAGSGVQHGFACCGVAEGSECCGDPEARDFPCPWCQSGWATSDEILAYAKETGDLRVLSEHEANVMLEAILPRHPARKPRPSRSL